MTNEKQQSLRRSNSSPSFCFGRSTTAEFCGVTTAGCAAICCCGPCSVVNLVVLAVYKLPRRAIRRLRRRRVAKKLSKVRSSQLAVHPFDDDIYKSATEIDLTEEKEEEEDEAVVELEKEMWNRFYSGGFWRSLSQAETASFRKTD